MESDTTKRVTEENIEEIFVGVSRHEFAKAALQGILGSFTEDDHKLMDADPEATVRVVCKTAYMFADGMMKEGGLA